MRMSIERGSAAWEADLGAFWWCAGGLGRFLRCASTSMYSSRSLLFLGAFG